MLALDRAAWGRNREAAGFLVSLAFVALASVRDVYLGGLFQRWSPLHVAIVAFTLCSVVFLPIAWARDPKGLRILLRRPGELFWVNVTSAIAWISFFQALKAIEPALVQVLFSGVGPLTVRWLDRLVPGAAPPATLHPAEGPCHLGLLASLVATASITLAGVSGAGALPLGVAAFGVALAAGAGVSISVNTVLCKKLNQAGVNPAALVALRFPGAIVVAAVLSGPPGDLAALPSIGALAPVAGAALLLIVFPVYVSQVGVSLASPLTVRVAFSLAPVFIFALQLFEGRLASSPYSLAAAGVYCVFAVGGAVARQRATRGVAFHLNPGRARPQSAT